MERQKIITYLISAPVPKKQSFKILQAIDANGEKNWCAGHFYDLSKIALPLPPGHFIDLDFELFCL